VTLSGNRERIILIVDTGVDDALALALAVRHPRIQLDAVLTTWGNVDLEKVNANTLRVLEWLEAPDVPVYAAAAEPLQCEAFDASDWHGSDGLGGARIPPTTRSAQHGGVEYLIRTLREEPKAINVVCTGPFTALALAIQRDSAFVENVKQVVVMGGAAHLPGNTTPTAEYNVYADPEAAAIVFDQRWPLVMVGLDVTNRVTLSRLETAAIAGMRSREAELVAEVTRHLFLGRQVDAMALHDPLAVAVVVEPGLVTTAPGPVVVETRGEHTRGQTIVDWRPRRTRPPSNTRVCVDVDVEAARSLFFDTLGVQ
jgi:inosine-uridine nucleoside N-ribohydrolase